MLPTTAKPDKAADENSESEDEGEGTSSTTQDDNEPPQIVLWSPSKEEQAEGAKPVVVDRSISSFLREHQIEGVKFLFECCSGMRDYEGFGCILADDMGLGKTFQSITLLFTLLRQGARGKAACKKGHYCMSHVACRKLGNEIQKWLKGKVGVVAVSESSKKGGGDPYRDFCLLDAAADPKHL